MSTPEPPPEPPEPPERMGAPGPTDVEPAGRMTVSERRALWWQREMAIVAVGILALLVGGAIGYVLGNSNTKTKTRTVAAPAKTTTVVSTPTTTRTATSETTVTTPQKAVTIPTKTITVPTAAKTVTVAVTHTVTHTTTVAAAPSTSTTPTASGTQTFTGTNATNVGTVSVPTQSQLRWSCAGCGSTGFTITNNPHDASSIPVNSQGATSGQAVVAAGTYTNVMVQGTGPWSVTITAQG